MRKLIQSQYFRGLSAPDAYLKQRSDNLKTDALVQYRRIGEVHRRKGDMPAALSYFHKTLETRKRLLGPKHCAQCHFQVARIYHELQDLDASLAHYSESLECHAEAAHGGKVNGETVDVAAAFSEMALLHEQKGQFHKAWELCQRAMDRGRSRAGKSVTGGSKDCVENDIVALQGRLQARNSHPKKTLSDELQLLNHKPESLSGLSP